MSFYNDFRLQYPKQSVSHFATTGYRTSTYMQKLQDAQGQGRSYEDVRDAAAPTGRTQRWQNVWQNGYLKRKQTDSTHILNYSAESWMIK